MRIAKASGFEIQAVEMLKKMHIFVHNFAQSNLAHHTCLWELTSI